MVLRAGIRSQLSLPVQFRTGYRRNGMFSNIVKVMGSMVKSLLWLQKHPGAA